MIVRSSKHVVLWGHLSKLIMSCKVLLLLSSLLALPPLSFFEVLLLRGLRGCDPEPVLKECLLRIIESPELTESTESRESSFSFFAHDLALLTPKADGLGAWLCIVDIR